MQNRTKDKSCSSRRCRGFKDEGSALQRRDLTCTRKSRIASKKLGHFKRCLLHRLKLLIKFAVSVSRNSLENVVFRLICLERLAALAVLQPSILLIALETVPRVAICLRGRISNIETRDQSPLCLTFQTFSVFVSNNELYRVSRKF